MRRKNTIESFNHAFRGLLYSLKTQRHMRWHLFIGSAVFCLSLWLRLTKIEVLIVVGTVTLVIMAELFNTAVEVAVDLFTREFHPLAAVAKDVAAGAVLLASINAVIVGYIVFVPNLGIFLPSVVEQVRRSPPYLTLAALVAVITIVIILKSLKRPSGIMQGGMPSGHTAVAFALGTTVVFLARHEPAIVVPVVLLVLLVAESRLETRIHSFLEVLAGAAIGFLLTTAVFQFLTG